MGRADIGVRQPANMTGGLIRVVFIAIVFGLTPTIHAQIPSSEHRLWTVGLGVVPLYNQLNVPGSEVSEAGSVVFIDSRTIAVTYRFAGRDSSQATDAVSFFDADTGAVRDSLQWSSADRFPANRNFVRVLPTHNGEFLVMVGRSLRHYSVSHKELNSRPLPYGNDAAWEWIVKVSPDGKLALMKRFGPGANADHWISTETLEDRTVAPAPFYQYGYEVGQGFVVYSASGSDSESTEPNPNPCFYGRG